MEIWHAFTVTSLALKRWKEYWLECVRVSCLVCGLQGLVSVARKITFKWINYSKVQYKFRLCFPILFYIYSWQPVPLMGANNIFLVLIWESGAKQNRYFIRFWYNTLSSFGMCRVKSQLRNKNRKIHRPSPTQWNQQRASSHNSWLHPEELNCGLPVFSSMVFRGASACGLCDLVWPDSLPKKACFCVSAILQKH